ncbi:MAG: hypothetical protein M1820_000894 [Bogoriella megaspora]|nr:MAG: hypothetical protein M1820_000894 [Bogoriella megaspora]
MAHPTTSNPKNVWAPPETFQHVAITPIFPTTKLVTLAGQVGIKSGFDDIPEKLTDQVKIAHENVHKCLQSVGASPRDIIHARHYIVQNTGNPKLDDKELPHRGWSPLWNEFLNKNADGHRPPDTVVGVASLAKKELLYEIEVWAVINAQPDS